MDRFVRLNLDAETVSDSTGGWPYKTGLRISDEQLFRITSSQIRKNVLAYFLQINTENCHLLSQEIGDAKWTVLTQ